MIMALAFSGMIANDNKFLNQFGFIMIVGAAVHTLCVVSLAHLKHGSARTQLHISSHHVRSPGLAIMQPLNGSHAGSMLDCNIVVISYASIKHSSWPPLLSLACFANTISCPTPFNDHRRYGMSVDMLCMESRVIDISGNVAQRGIH